MIMGVLYARMRSIVHVTTRLVTVLPWFNERPCRSTPQNKDHANQLWVVHLWGILGGWERVIEILLRDSVSYLSLKDSVRTQYDVPRTSMVLEA